MASAEGSGTARAMTSSSASGKADGKDKARQARAQHATKAIGFKDAATRLWTLWPAQARGLSLEDPTSRRDGPYEDPVSGSPWHVACWTEAFVSRCKDVCPSDSSLRGRPEKQSRHQDAFRKG